MTSQTANEGGLPGLITKPGVFSSKQHDTCNQRVDFALKHNPYVKLMLEAMKSTGCAINRDRHIVCEPCNPGSPIQGGFDPINNQIVICENKTPTQRVMSSLLTHELIHAFDHCRAKVDWTDLTHVACSEIRAASLSSDCSFLSTNIYGFNYGIKKHHQKCVRNHARRSIQATRDLSKEDAEKAIDSVWDSCFNDFAPFDRIPQGPSDARRARSSKYYSQSL
ncbi:mitochondrial inner membrane protease ATP23 homolog [Amphiura filiformis]|uniref:mitochondrial inner membrane protease ATP23 homolog n=1 Tax=Amphiura filiformis TaxID=82378 RepID=UPI003B221340